MSVVVIPSSVWDLLEEKLYQERGPVEKPDALITPCFSMT
jgi:hypothetical protein